MNKKGFTLVEIIITISLMVLIMAIAFPTVSFFVRKNDTKAIKTQENEFISLAKLFVSKNINTFNTLIVDECAFLSLDDMIEEELLDKIPELDKKKYVGSNGVQIYKERDGDTGLSTFNYKYAESKEDVCFSLDSFSFESRPNNDMAIPPNENVNYGVIPNSTVNYDYLYEGNENYGSEEPPIVNEFLIPVVYDGFCNGMKGCFRKADTSKKWYGYKNGNWANAVLVKDSTIFCEINDGSPASLKDCPVHTPILSNQIINQYVWIPRWASYTSSAFVYGEYEITGFWVEKDGADDHDNKYTAIINNRGFNKCCTYNYNGNETYCKSNTSDDNSNNVCGYSTSNIYGIKDSTKGRIYNEYTLNNIKSDNNLE